MFLAVLVLALGEEIGWRGYALPRLFGKRNASTASVILGLLWAGWHLPLYAWPREDSGLAFYAVNSAAFVAASVLITWLFLNSGRSLLIAVLYHAAYNTSTAWVRPALGEVDWLTVSAALAALLWIVVAAVVATAGSRHLIAGSETRRVA